MDRDLRVKDVTTMHLFASDCPGCNKLQVHGFWQQLEKTYHCDRWRVVVHYACRECGHKWDSTLKLTTQRKLRPRLIDWSDFGWLALKWWPTMPLWFRWWMLWAVFWLERRVKI
jgi:hypothetical protein